MESLVPRPAGHTALPTPSTASGGEGFPLDNSQLDTFRTCAESYRLKYRQGLRLIDDGTQEVQLRFGGALHAGLESFYLKHTPQVMADRFLALYPKAPTEEELCYTPPNGLKVLQGYPAYAAQNDKDWKVLGVELQDTFELVPGLPYLVRIDLLIETPSGLWFVDHKTTGSYFNESFWRRFDMSGQITGYTDYVQRKYGQCSGGIINAIRLKHRERMYRGEPAGFVFQHERQIFNRLPNQVQQWREDTVKTIERLRSLDPSQSWERSYAQCHRCSYLQLCQSAGSEEIKQVLYESHDPYAYLKEEG